MSAEQDRLDEARTKDARGGNGDPISRSGGREPFARRLPRFYLLSGTVSVRPPALSSGRSSRERTLAEAAARISSCVRSAEGR